MFVIYPINSLQQRVPSVRADLHVWSGRKYLVCLLRCHSVEAGFCLAAASAKLLWIQQNLYCVVGLFKRPVVCHDSPECAYLHLAAAGTWRRGSCIHGTLQADWKNDLFTSPTNKMLHNTIVLIPTTTHFQSKSKPLSVFAPRSPSSVMSCRRLHSGTSPGTSRQGSWQWWRVTVTVL